VITDFRHRGRLLKSKATRYGHRYVSLCGDAKPPISLAVHRLVMAAFKEPMPDGHQVAHIDGDAGNNRAENLVWATPKLNQSHRIEHGTDDRGEKSVNHKLKSADVQEIRRLRGTLLQREIAQMFGVSRGYVSTVQRQIYRKFD
jgi:hypothetical protein